MGDGLRYDHRSGKMNYRVKCPGVKELSKQCFISGIAFDPSGDRAAACSESGQVVIWDIDH